ncbi:MAG: hypothetical protein H7228_13335 [Polaromonas sp.]|nr:hypothetical protein [Polaromonas sp.]
MKSTLSYTFAWLAAAGLAFAMAFAAPNVVSVMGRMPAFMSQTLMREPVTVPEGLPSDRTLALITFQRSHRAEAESWITGLNLKNDPSITWLRMPVVNDPGTSKGRDAVESRLLQHYKGDAERSNLVPVFTSDRASFVRDTGLSGTERSYAVVINRRGEVLARVEGEFDAEKAQTLRETLKGEDF